MERPEAGGWRPEATDYGLRTGRLRPEIGGDRGFALSDYETRGTREKESVFSGFAALRAFCSGAILTSLLL
jgi:hypothetical protein